MTEDEEKLLIGELAKKAGVSVRTIRYYIHEGLLPTPDTRGRYTLYDEEYIKRIQLIRLLKKNYLPLKEIRLILDMLDPKDIDQALKRYSKSASLVGGKVIAQKIEDSDSAAEYIHKVINSQREFGIIGEGAPRYAPPSSKRRLGDKSPSKKSHGDTWQRIRLADGIELHIVDEKNIDDTTLEQLLQAIRKILK